MIKNLKINNVGPAPEMDLEFGDRLNLLTGDNGLGKSFLLDIIWWSLTRSWPEDVNPKLTSGRMATPTGNQPASISIGFGPKTMRNHQSTLMSVYDWKQQGWCDPSGYPGNPGLVVYAMVDGSFAVWDEARNYNGKLRALDRFPAYVFSPTEVWDGLPEGASRKVCNGLIQDWASWQREGGSPFKSLCALLQALSPPDSAKITPGELVRISLDDSRHFPTLKMPYGADVPILHASAGMKRIIALTYLLIWAWEEHKAASTMQRLPLSHRIVFLIDEIECHLHPKWQQRIVKALLSVLESLTGQTEVQMIVATHSPLVLTSVESQFNPKTDAWFDLEQEAEGETRKVVLTRRDFEPHGDSSSWLTSEAFGLKSTRDPEYEQLLNEAAGLVNEPGVDGGRIAAMRDRLAAALSPTDPFLFRWRGICEKKGLLT